MKMNVTTLVAPSAEPLGLAEAKDYLRIAFDGEDELVTGLISGARSRIEETARVALITRTLRVTLDRWPARTVETRVLRLPVRPADGLISVKVFDAEGAPESVTGRFTLSPGRSSRLIWTSGAFPWPRARANAIEVEYTAGFGEAAEDVPEALSLALKRLVAHAYHSRDAATLRGELPEDVAGLISPWRRVSL
jgi:uncharacterized phiE125 gp8 family phage protein